MGMNIDLFRFTIQLGETPASAAGEFVESEFASPLLADLSPALVKHLRFGTVQVGSGASKMSFDPRERFRSWPVLLVISSFFLQCGCATDAARAAKSPFKFAEDTLAFPNEMHWVYEFDETGVWRIRDREPPPEYALRCFPLTRATREFAYHARFAPEEPLREEAFYEEAVRKVIGRSSERISPKEERVMIPGFAHLKEFSSAYPHLFKENCGSAVSSYLQRGNWRCALPFSRASQERVAGDLREKLREGRLPIIHLTEFPMLNHGLLVYAVREEDGVLYFESYDPNTPAAPVFLRYYIPNRTFVLPHTPYFYGGDVNVYEVYNGCFY